MKDTKTFLLLREVKRRLYAKTRDLGNQFLIAALRLRGKRKITINQESRKLAYVGHSYHAKTQSTGFLIEYLREFFDLEVIWDESWKGASAPDLSFIDSSYLGVVFFQSIPAVSVLESLGTQNIVLIPMFDGITHEFGNWYPYKKYKFLNFSRELHREFCSWGLCSTYLQYYPAPQVYSPGKEDRVFFWQRTSRINIDLLEKLLGNFDATIHLHHALDPGQVYSPPSLQQEGKFSIAYSNWFPTRGDMWKVLSECGVYVAPRELEGIGMSFLEAMSQGKAVIAPNAPTMNEYIEHGKTGYLYSISLPEEIDFSDIQRVQEAAYSSVVRGHEEWMRSRTLILNTLRLGRF